MEEGGNVMQVSGRLTMETVAGFLSEGLPTTEDGSDLTVDLAQVDVVDSSAVSLMLAWLRAAQRNNVRLSFINVPDNLLSLANLYGVAESLSLPAEDAAA
ncbi:MAG: STAS domain-containing protein [Gallionellaceae bacterium]|nr:MAG: STAS domain-containing protein [Gallionellaceae bacterium]